MITMNKTEYLNTCEYGPHYVKMVNTMAPRFKCCSNLPHKYAILKYNKTGKQANRLSLSRFSRQFIVPLVSLFMEL